MEFTFKFIEERATSIIRLEEKPKERKRTIRADSFEKAMEILKHILYNSQKDAFHDFSVCFNDSWQNLLIDDNHSTWVFKSDIRKTKFTLLKIK